MKKKIIGLTGGIGSGKTTVAKFFEKEGIPIYNSDIRAKQVMNEDLELKKQIIQLFGEESYLNDQLNRPYIASKTFSNPKKLAQLNALVHPAVYRDFDLWINRQTSSIVLKEAAILIETGGYKLCDILVVVMVDQEIRIQRTIERDGLSREDVISRINNQTTDDSRIKLADFIIDNSQDLIHLEQQVKEVVLEIKKLP